MNLLLMTQNLPDADFTRRELAKVMPGVRVEVSPDAHETIRRLAAPGHYSAVLLDSGFRLANPLEVVKALRAGDRAIAVIGLIEPSDLDSGIDVLGAGADDYVVKRPGFIATLADVVQRACARHGALQKPEPKAPHARRITTGATCVLLRNVVGADASPTDASEVDQSGGRTSGKPAEAVSAEQFPAEPGCEPAVHEDAQPGAFLASHEGQTRVEALAPAAISHKENEESDQDTRLGRTADPQRALEGPPPGGAGDSQERGQSRPEPLALRNQIEELESRCRGLEENVRAAHASLAEQAALLQLEREQRAVETEELGKRLNLLEEQRQALASALSSKEEEQRESNERHVAELQDLSRQREELERGQRLLIDERARLESVLRDLEAQLAERAEELRAGSEQWELQRIAWSRAIEAVAESYAKIEREVLLHDAERQEQKARLAAELTRSENTSRAPELELRRGHEEQSRPRGSRRAEEFRFREDADYLHTGGEPGRAMPPASEQERAAVEPDELSSTATREESAMAHSECLARAEDPHPEAGTCASAEVTGARLPMAEHFLTVEEKEELERIHWSSAGCELDQEMSTLEEEARLIRQSIQELVRDQEAYGSKPKTR